MNLAPELALLAELDAALSNAFFAGLAVVKYHEAGGEVDSDLLDYAYGYVDGHNVAYIKDWEKFTARTNMHTEQFNKFMEKTS